MLEPTSPPPNEWIREARAVSNSAFAEFYLAHQPRTQLLAFSLDLRRLWLALPLEAKCKT
jgi:hypothetical protein